MNNKGAMELSVTAIVILILAIVMLGLGLGFIRGMFTKVSTSFDEQISLEPEPSDPSASEPITLSRESPILNSGDSVALKVGIHNPSGDPWTDARFNITCGSNPLVTKEQFNTQNLLSGESFKGTFLFKVGKIADGTYLCLGKSLYKVGAQYLDTNYTKDMTIKIVK